MNERQQELLAKIAAAKKLVLEKKRAKEGVLMAVTRKRDLLRLAQADFDSVEVAFNEARRAFNIAKMDVEEAIDALKYEKKWEQLRGVEAGDIVYTHRKGMGLYGLALRVHKRTKSRSLILDGLYGTERADADREERDYKREGYGRYYRKRYMRLDIDHLTALDVRKEICPDAVAHLLMRKGSE